MGQFLNAKSFLFFGLTSFAVLVLIECDAYVEFSCKKSSENALPKFPPASSSDIRLNFATKAKTVELRHYTDEKRESLEIFAPGRHVKYIVHENQHLFIKFLDDDFPSCVVKTSSKIELEEEDSGDNNILQKILDATHKPSEFINTDPAKEVVNGVFIKKWEGCFNDPKINVSLSFSEIDWKNPGKGTERQRIPVMMEAQLNNDFVIGIIDNFQSSMPDDIYFQPPADVFCPGFRENMKPPEIPDFFSYDSETLMFMSKTETPFFVSHSSVYYDYPSLVARVDFHDFESDMPDGESDMPDGKSDLKVKGTSKIHDFKSKILYRFDLPAYKCEVEEYITTDNVAEEKETKDSPMDTGKEYFALDAKKISYNGQFTTRGYVADVYTALVPHYDKSKGNTVYTWYFSAVQTQIADKEKVDKNVLLRLDSHPETGKKRKDRVEQNFYNFEKQEPTSQIYDISNCYNESLSKLFVITFPANKALKGSENFVKSVVHFALKDVTKISKQRIFVSGVTFNNQYMFATFKLLEDASALKAKAAKKELSLSDAAAKIKSAVKDGSLKLSVSTKDGLISLIPLESGFNEFSGDMKVMDPSSYKQGSVIGLTIGMLLLGFVVGGVALNLAVSRKFGVSLFQKKSGMNNFNNPLN